MFFLRKVPIEYLKRKTEGAKPMFHRRLQELPAKRAPRQKLLTRQLKFNVPKIVEDRWTSWANSTRRQGDRKKLGTAMAVIMMGLPEPLIQILLRWGDMAESDSHVATDVKSLVQGFADEIGRLMLDRSEAR